MYRVIAVVLLCVLGRIGYGQKPAIEFDQKEVRFGAQGIGIQSCQNLTVKNTSDQPLILIGLGTSDPAHFSIPSPTQAMLPVTIRRGGKLDLSICFTPDKVQEYKTELTFRTGKETAILPISAKGIKPEDVAKLPQTELSVKAPKKKQKDYIISLKMPKAAKLVLQLIDPLGTVIKTYINNEIMNEGNYEFAFNGTDPEGKQLEGGTYYLRLEGMEMYTNKPIKLSKTLSYKR